MKRHDEGFTLIELLIVIAIFGFVLSGVSQMVVSLLTAHRQQSKIAETSIEGIIGLEMLRQDLGKAGYGLPWNGSFNYNEAASGIEAGLNDATTYPPRGIVSINNGGWNGTDYLAVKATNVATDRACSIWNFLSSSNTSTQWSSAMPTGVDNFISTDRVIILNPGSLSTASAARTLVTLGASFYAQWGSAAAATLASTMTSTGIAYGIDSTTNLRMPFNRADYYVKRPATGMPQRCATGAPGTGILYKAVVNQSDGKLTEFPLLDCVADMQVIFRYDPLGSGSVTLTATDDIITNTALWGTAQAIRDKVKEVRVYILAHEGQRDVNFNYATNTIKVGEDSTVGTTVGRVGGFNLTGITNWQNYRWKIYTLVVKLDNLL